MRVPDAFDHDAWRVAFATGISYGLLLLVAFLLLFVVPFLAFRAS